MITTLAIDALAGSDPAGLTPAQHALDRGARSLDEPGVRLMQAVLAAAVQDYVRYACDPGATGRAGFDAVARWFASADAEWAFSFLAICEVLDLDPAAVREHLARRVAGYASGATRRPPVIRRSVARRTPLAGRAKSVGSPRLAAAAT